MTSTSRMRLVSLVEIAALVGCALWLLGGSANRLDLHPADEVLFLRQGQQLLAGTWPPGWLAWAPLLSLAYGAVTAVGVAPWHASDVMLAVAASASGLALRWALRAILPGWIAFVLAWSWVASAFVVQSAAPMMAPNRSLLASAFAFAAVGCWARGRTALAVLALAAATLERSEHCLWSTGLGAALLVSDVRRRRLRGRTLAVLALALASWALLMLSPAHRARAWLAFQQHYAARVAWREEAPGADRLARTIARFERHQPVLERDFPGARSIVSAARVAPVRFAEHVADNALGTVPAVWQLLAARFAWSDGARAAWIALALAPLALALALRRRRLRSLLARLPAGAPVALFSAAAMLLTALVVAPRPDVLLPLVPLLGTAVGLGWWAWIEVGGRREPALSLGAALLAGVAVALLPRPFPRYPELHVVLRDGVDAVRRALPAEVSPGGDLFAVSGPAVPDWAGLPALQGRGPSGVVAALGGGLEGLAQRPPAYVIVHWALAEGMPAFTAGLLQFVTERDYRLLEVTPRCLLYARRP